ncbi:MAG: aminomethyltransferase family protein, partial [Chloroflexi bacterium]|nr:aminomethyltransferase family protein [Chloroflexota bacterium]
LMDRSALGRIELTGKDRVDFVQRMSTNDLKTLGIGSGLQTVLTTPEAKIIDLLTVYAQLESLLLITSPQNRAKVLNWFKRHIFFRDKVKPTDVSDRMAQLTLFGPRADNLLSSFSADFALLPSFHSRALTLAGIAVRVARVPHIAGGGYDLIVSADDAERLWDVLLEAGAPLGIQPMGTTAFNWLRLEAGQPLYGFELSGAHNPLEARLDHAVSFSKGCYTGQEVIARLDTYQKLKQRLSAVRLDELPRAPLPLPIRMENNEVGTLTSVAQLPEADHAIGLGYIRTKFVQPNAPISVHTDDGAVTGVLIELPAAQPKAAQ